MTYWLVGEEDPDSFADLAGLGLYVLAGTWCLRQVRYRPEAEIPAEWFIPGEVIKGWRATATANRLAGEGIWERVQGGYRFAVIRPENTADDLRAKRKRERAKKAKSKPIPQGNLVQFPRGIGGDSPGDVYGGIG